MNSADHLFLLAKKESLIREREELVPITTIELILELHPEKGKTRS
jgi:hypothetical protein